VSSVTNMDYMFSRAIAFKRHLCDAAWVHSKASKTMMFARSRGSISPTVCTSTSPRPIRVRELIVRTAMTTSAITPKVANAVACPKCGTFKKSGRVSCCAPGGVWFKNCGGAGNRNVDHSWFEGVEACKRKFKATAYQIHISSLSDTVIASLCVHL